MNEKLPPAHNFTKVYTLKTIFGPPVNLEITFQKNKSWLQYSYIIKEGHKEEADQTVASKSSSSILDPSIIIDVIGNTILKSQRETLEQQLYEQGRQSVELLLQNIDNQNPKIRESAVIMSRWFPELVPLQKLVGRLHDSNKHIAQEALFSLNIKLLNEGRDIDETSKQHVVPQMLKLFIKDLVINPNYDHGSYGSSTRWFYFDNTAVFFTPVFCTGNTGLCSLNDKVY
ncbi:hypothetical protein ACFL27_16740 [candidate division CSSED10-310 bacterium]|uniref:HEAT repeat domain-containing protein n=1 Tax=candidate division CSSED10-310 bacterium TaxID=2855610 RepID=A0ABV6Z069_UNCC1